MSQLDAMAIISELTNLAHRGVSTNESAQARDLLKNYLRDIGAEVETQAFQTPKTYISAVSWFIGGLLLGLVLLGYNGLIGLFFIAVSAFMAWRFFDWRSSLATSLPPQVTGHNVIGHFPAKTASTKRLILMAHYDTAPISYLYRPEMVKDFVRSLRISLAFLIFAVIFAFLWMLGLQNNLMIMLRWLLFFYFFAQWTLSVIDYFRFGFSNGASDNTTGVAVVITAAEAIKTSLPDDWSLDIVLTDAEEVGMIGARAYYLEHKQHFSENSYLLNVDTVGRGSLKIFTQTGTLSNIVYHNTLVELAKKTASEARFSTVEESTWRTGDFDSVWFARDGIDCLTLGAQDEQNGMPNIHRPEDTLDHLEPELVQLALEFVEATAGKLIEVI
jgi:hypothetical protein